MSARAEHEHDVPTRRVAFAVMASPVAWTLHLMGSYLIVALWCSAEWDGYHLALGVWTLLCAALGIVGGISGLRLWREGRTVLREDAEPGTPQSWDSRFGERGARFAFLAVIAVASAGLFTYLIILQGLTPLFAPACWAGTTS